jgi:hypothetical protein
MKNTSRTLESHPASPATGTRSRIGHVVRWHAEPVFTEETREVPDRGEVNDFRVVQASAQPM